MTVPSSLAAPTPPAAGRPIRRLRRRGGRDRLVLVELDAERPVRVRRGRCRSARRRRTVRSEQPDGGFRQAASGRQAPSIAPRRAPPPSSRSMPVAIPVGPERLGPNGYSNAWQPMARRRRRATRAFTTRELESRCPRAAAGSTSLCCCKFSAGGAPSWTPPATIPQDAWGQLDQSSASWWGAPWSGGRLAVDPSGGALVSTSFAGTADFGSAGKLTSAGGFDSAVLRFDAQGHLIGGARWGGADDEFPVDAVAIGAFGDRGHRRVEPAALVGGSTRSTADRVHITPSSSRSWAGEGRRS